jgi:hypothetical protein
MAGRREVKVKIRPDGSVSFEVSCAPGQTCVELTKELEAALGIVKAREYTTEYYVEEESVTVKTGKE